MNEFQRLMEMVFEFMRHDINLYGYHFSVWGVIMFASLGAIVMYFIRELFS